MTNEEFDNRLDAYNKHKQDITAKNVLFAFAKFKRLSWSDFVDENIFENIAGENERSRQLRNVLADLIKDGSIVPIDTVWPTWEYNLTT
jgi:hypothetical protein